MVMYIYGLMLGMMFFMTLPMIIILFIIDSVILLLSNFISIYALAESIKGRIFRNNAIPIIAIVCQFFFCIDVISIFAVFFKAKRKPENILKTCVQQTE